MEANPKVIKWHPGVSKSEPIGCKSEPKESQKGANESPKKPSGAKRVPKVSQRVTKIIKKNIFGKGREKGAKMVRESYEVWVPFGGISCSKSIKNPM